MAKGELASRARQSSPKKASKAKAEPKGKPKSQKQGKPSNQKSVKQPTPHTKGVASLTNHGETNSPIFTKGHTMKRLLLIITLVLFSAGALTEAFAAPARGGLLLSAPPKRLPQPKKELLPKK